METRLHRINPDEDSCSHRLRSGARAELAVFALRDGSGRETVCDPAEMAFRSSPVRTTSDSQFLRGVDRSLCEVVRRLQEADSGNICSRLCRNGSAPLRHGCETVLLSKKAR